MLTAKEIFIRDKQLSSKWSAWAQSEDGAKVFATANSEFLAISGLGADMIRGARLYLHILEELADAYAAPPEYPTSGLDHDLEPPTRTAKTK